MATKRQNSLFHSPSPVASFRVVHTTEYRLSKAQSTAATTMTEYCGETTTKRRARSNTPFSFILHPPPTTHKRIFLNHSRAHSFPLSSSSRPSTRPRWYPTHITKPWDSGLVGGFHQYKTRPHTFPRDFPSTTTTIKLSKCGGGGGGCFGRKRGWMEMVSGWGERALSGANDLRE